MHFSGIFHIDTTLSQKAYVEDTLISAISEGGWGTGAQHWSQKDHRCVWHTVGMQESLGKLMNELNVSFMMKSKATLFM